MTTDPTTAQELRELRNEELRDYAQDHADRESAIEEVITDLVERAWDRLTGEDDLVDEWMQGLAEKLGIALDTDEFGDMYGQVVNASWIGLGIKIASHFQDLAVENAKATLA